jgi:hypothetical protein
MTFRDVPDDDGRFRRLCGDSEGWGDFFAMLRVRARTMSECTEKKSCLQWLRRLATNRDRVNFIMTSPSRDAEFLGLSKTYASMILQTWYMYSQSTISTSESESASKFPSEFSVPESLVRSITVFPAGTLWSVLVSPCRKARSSARRQAFTFASAVDMCYIKYRGTLSVTPFGWVKVEIP